MVPEGWQESLLDQAAKRRSGHTPDKTKPRNSSGKYGSYAVQGRYYLIISANRDGAEAAEKARQFGGKVIRPRGRGFHKVSVFSSTNKEEVIAARLGSAPTCAAIFSSVVPNSVLRALWCSTSLCRSSTRR